jgi:choline kinase
MPTVRHAVISAAGFGSRLGLNMPKCLVQVGGHALIDYQLDLLQDVPDLRIVVGFKEEEVIAHVRQQRPDAIFVRNPEFYSTSNSHSVYLASQHFKEAFLSIDGDLLIQKADFERTLAESANGKPWIGVTKCKSEEPVYATLRDGENITSLSFTDKSDWEWCGIALVPPGVIGSNPKYVFEELKKTLPARAAKLSVYEIDTPQDYAMATDHLAELGYDLDQAG